MECDNKDTRHNEEKKSSLLSCAKLRIASVFNASTYRGPRIRFGREKTMIERKANLLEEPLGCSTLKCGDSKSRCLRFSGLNEFTYGNDRTRDDKTFFKRATNIHYLSWKAMRLNRAQHLSYQPELEAQTS